MPREPGARRPSYSKAEDQYLLLVHKIPQGCRWQELKDIAREYCGHVSKADTIAPDHQFGHVLINGRTSALKAHETFREKGWRGHPIEVSLHGPIQQGVPVDNIVLKRLQLVQPRAVGPSGHPKSMHVPQITSPGYQVASPPYPSSAVINRTPGRPHPSLAGPEFQRIPAPVLQGAHYDRHHSGHYQGVSVDIQPSPVTAYRGVPPVRSSGSREGPPREVHDYGLRHGPSGRGPEGQSHAIASRGAERTIRLANLPKSCRKADVYELLRRYGDVEIQSCQSSSHRAHTVVAYASFRSATAATKAIADLHERKSDGRRLEARIAVPSSTRPRSSASDAKDKRVASTKAAEPVKGPLVVDGATGTRLRYRRHHSSAASNDSKDDSDDASSDSDENSSSSSSDEDVNAMIRHVGKMHLRRG